MDYNIAVMNPENRKPRTIEPVILARENKPVLSKMAKRPVEYRPENEFVSGDVSIETSEFSGESSVRHSDLGEIFIRSFRNANKDKLLQVPQRVSGKGIPKVEFVRFTPFPSLEKAIRACDHIAEKYEPTTGSESLSLTQIIKLLQKMSAIFQDPNINKGQLEEFAQNAMKEVVGANFDTANLDWKKHIVEGIEKAFQNDKIGRPNRSRSRLITAHLYPLATEARVVNKRTNNKYRRISNKLLEQRHIHVGRFEDSISMIEELRNLKDVEFSQKRSELLQFARFHVDKDTMKFAPYSGVAAKMRFLLLGKPDQIDILQKYIGEDAKKYSRRKEFKKMDVTHQKARLKEIGKMLEQTLIESEQNLIEGEDDWIWKSEI